MRDTDLIAAARMRLEGRSWADVGQRLAYDPEYLRTQMQSRVMGRASGNRKGPFPNVRDEIDRSWGGSVAAFAQAIGVSRQFVHRVLDGVDPMSEALLEKIQSVTGLSKEQIMERGEEV